MIGGPIGERQGWLGRVVDGFARVRTGLLTIIVITTLLLLWLIVSFWIDAYVQRRDAVLTLAATELDAGLWLLVQASSRELVVSETLLSRPDAASEDDLGGLGRARRDTDLAIDNVVSAPSLRGLVRSAGALAAFEARTAAMVETRGLVDVAISRASRDRDGESRKAWWSAHTGFVDALGR
jgi:hypothetical protein